jgi:hypothetical protein
MCLCSSNPNNVGRLGGRVGDKNGQHELLVAVNMVNGARFPLSTYPNVTWHHVWPLAAIVLAEGFVTYRT